MTLPLPECRPRPGRLGAFTVLELLVAMTILSIILVITAALVGQVSRVWKKSSARIDAFQGARLAFEMITRNLSQATLNPYLGFDSDTNPHYYLRKSDLRFLCGPAGANSLPGTSGTGSSVFFQAPLGYTAATTTYGGMDALLNTVGYYVSFTDAPTPSYLHLTTPYRYRLMQLLAPTESDTVYASAATLTWITGATSTAVSVADNVVALLIRPQDPSATPPDIGSTYAYDSYDPADASPTGTVDTQKATSAQLPPVLQVTLVAIEEASALPLQNGSTQPAKIVAALAGRFAQPSQYATDLAAVTAAFDAAGIRYRIFSGTVPLAESKWTK